MITIDPATNRTLSLLACIRAGLCDRGSFYGYRGRTAHSTPRRAACALMLPKVLLDPYGRGGGLFLGKYKPLCLLPRRGINASTAMKSVVVDSRSYDWERRRARLQRPGIPDHHLRDCTLQVSRRHANSGVYGKKKKAARIAGFDREDSISQATRDHCRLNCCRCFQFDALDAPSGHVNYWGYAPDFVFCAPPGLIAHFEILLAR